MNVPKFGRLSCASGIEGGAWSHGMNLLTAMLLSSKYIIADPLYNSSFEGSTKEIPLASFSRMCRAVDVIVVQTEGLGFPPCPRP